MERMYSVAAGIADFWPARNEASWRHRREPNSFQTYFDGVMTKECVIDASARDALDSLQRMPNHERAVDALRQFCADKGIPLEEPAPAVAVVGKAGCSAQTIPPPPREPARVPWVSPPAPPPETISPKVMSTIREMGPSAVASAKGRSLDAFTLTLACDDPTWVP